MVKKSSLSIKKQYCESGWNVLERCKLQKSNNQEEDLYDKFFNYQTTIN